MKEKPLCTSSYKFYIKDKSPKNHWVGHSLVKAIDADKFFNIRVIISELESSLNYDCVIDASIFLVVKTEASVFVELVQEYDRTVFEVVGEV